MFFKDIHSTLSFKRLFRFLIGMAIGLQLIIVTFNHLSAYHELDNLQQFILRLARGTLMSLVAGFLLAYPDLSMIRSMNRIAPWGVKTLKRIAIQLGFAILIAMVVSTALTVFANWLQSYREDFRGVLLYNAMIYSVVNIIMMSILEGWIFYIESRQARQVAETLKEELSQIKFEVLRSQINPHFMFNSLNVLSALIHQDVGKAQQFIDEFSHIYRYVLETIEQPVVKLERELEFMRSYLFLQQIRYGDTLTYELHIPSELLEWVLPPLSLQVVLENAIKHNIVNEAKPLHIHISSAGRVLVIKNNIQPKISKGASTGLGLKNLAKRYAMVSSLEPDFQVETTHYVARLPLINIEQDESTDH
ncbi:MAG: histidine kinase [Bacteroidota bacterium]